MFVTNHVLSGVLLGQMLKRRPVTAFFIGVGSHLVLDSIPHWGCDTDAPGQFGRFLLVARRDGLLGLTIMAVAAAAVPKRGRASTVSAMAGAALLDLDKPLMIYVGLNPFPAVVNRLHGRVQRETSLGMPFEFAFGAALAGIDLLMVHSTTRRRSA